MAVYGFTINIEGNAAVQLKKIEQSLSSMGVKAKIEVEKTESAFSKLSGTIGGLKSMLLGGIGIGAAFAGFEFIKGGIEKFHELEQVTAKVGANLESSGNKAGMSMKDIEDMAKNLSSKVQFGRAEIMDMQSQLLTFPTITKATFGQSMAMVADIAKQTNHGLAETGIMFGKAFGDPSKGVASLRRYGVIFSEEEETKIKKLQESGKLVEAQNFMLDSISKSGYAGVAEKMFNADPIAKFKKQLGSIQVTLGEIFLGIRNAIVPVFVIVITKVKDFIKWMKDGGVGATILKNAVIGITAALIIYSTWTKIVAISTALMTWWHGASTAAIILNTLATEGLGAAMVALSIAMAASPIGLIVTAAIAAAVAIGVLWDKCEGFRAFIGSMGVEIIKIFTGIGNLFTHIGEIIGHLIHGRFDKMKSEGKALASDLKKDFGEGWAEAWDKGRQKGKDAKFKFSNLLSFGAKQEGATSTNGGGGSGGGKGAVTQGAINTSDLAGAKGGLGESKVINIRIDTMQKIEHVNGIDDFKGASQDAIEVLIRAVNNLAYSQSGTM